MLRLVCLSLALITTSCAPTVPVDGCLTMQPDPLVFPSVDLVSGDTPSVAELVIASTCHRRIDLDRIELDDTVNFSVTQPPQGRIKQGEQQTVQVRFLPDQHGEFAGVITLHSSHPGTPAIAVDVQASARAPQIEVSEPQVELGDTYIACPTSTPVRITNTGNRELLVRDVRATTGEEWSVDHKLDDNGTLPWSLEPYNANTGVPKAYIEYVHTPADAGLDTLDVVLVSNDPQNPELTITATGNGVAFGERRDTFDIADANKADVLITLDRSCSLTGLNEAVIDGIDGMVQQLKDQQINLRLAGTVTDDGCILGPDVFIDDSFSASQAQSTFLQMADPYVVASPYGANAERGFMLAHAALRPANTGPSGCNEGLLRDEAQLHIVHISDEPDQSINSWSDNVASLRALKPFPEDLTVHAFAGDVPDGCIEAAPGHGYYEVVQETGGQFRSVCSIADWRAQFASLATFIEPEWLRFPLAEPSVPHTIAVDVDGTPLTTGWTHAKGWVSVQVSALPVDAKSVNVAYVVAKDCEN